MQRVRVKDKVCTLNSEKCFTSHPSPRNAFLYHSSPDSRRLAVISAKDFTFRPRGRSFTRTLSRSDALGRYPVGIRLG